MTYNCLQAIGATTIFVLPIKYIKKVVSFHKHYKREDDLEKITFVAGGGRIGTSLPGVNTPYPLREASP